jgi:hypothetical protein
VRQLVAADLRVFANLATTTTGRRLLASAVIGMSLLALLSWWLASAVVDHPGLMQLLAERAGSSAEPFRPERALTAYGLMSCPMVAVWLGLGLAQRQLFEAPELTLWRLSPLRRTAGAVQVLLRATFLSCCWSSALAGPFVVAVLLQSSAAPAAFVLLPVAVLVATAPLLSLLLAVHVTLVRFLGGRRLRTVLTLLATLASVGFSTWLLLSLFQDSPQHFDPEAIADRTSGELPWTIAAAADLLADAAAGTMRASTALRVVGWLAATAAVFAVAARLHPRAVERHHEAHGGGARGRGRRWPGGLVAVVVKKELAQVVQQPGALVGLLVFAVLVFGLAHQRAVIGSVLEHTRLPQLVREVAALQGLWFLAVLFGLYQHMGRLVLWDGAQWPLYVQAPTAPRRLLAGKLIAIALLLSWPWSLVLLAGTFEFGVALRSLAVHGVLSLAGTAIALGVVAAVGTSPRLMRPGDDGAIVQGGRSFVAALLLVVTFELAVAPAVFGWLWLVDHAHRTRLDPAVVDAALPWALGAAITYGALVLGLGFSWASRNFRRLLRPR